jgi:hypothetical protein
MSNHHAFEVWAPAGGRWSPWAKPVVFACMAPDDVIAPFVASPWDAAWLSEIPEEVALVLDLPGDEGVTAALAVAAQGYRPVPLYNAIAQPTLSINARAELLQNPIAAVDVRTVMFALHRATTELAQLDLAIDAPPAFLLDANRRGGTFAPVPGTFDNRSVSLTTDFPSATFLKAHGIDGVILVQHHLGQPQSDLAHTLRQWQEGGLKIHLKRPNFPGVSVEFEVARPPRFRWLWHRLLATFRLRRSPMGGFGDYVPVPGSSG